MYTKINTKVEFSICVYLKILSKKLLIEMEGIDLLRNGLIEEDLFVSCDVVLSSQISVNKSEIILRVVSWGGKGVGVGVDDVELDEKDEWGRSLLLVFI